MTKTRGLSSGQENNSGASELHIGDKLLDDLFLVLTEVDSAGLQVLKRGAVAKSEVKRLLAIQNTSPVRPSTFPRLKQDRLVRFLLNLLFELELLVVPPQESIAVLSDACDKWLSATLETQLQSLFLAYLSSSWDELYQIPNLRIEVSGRRNAPNESRKAAILGLAKLPEGEWREFGDFFESAHQEMPGFLRPPSDPYNWKITVLAAGAGHHVHTEEGDKSFWLNLEGGLLGNYIYDPLYWLGVVKLRLSESGMLKHFAVTELGRMFMKGDFIKKPGKPKKHFVLQPDFEITVQREFDRSALFFLNRFANRTEIDAVFKFQVSKHSISRALQRGIDAKSIISFLKRHSLAGMPQNIEFSIKEWSAKFGNIRIRDAVILETADEFLMSEILSLQKVAAGLRERVGRRTALINPEHVDNLYRTLKREGYLPEIDNALKKAGPDIQSYSFSQQQSLAVFACALALSDILMSLETDLPSLRKLRVDEEFLSTRVPYKLMLRVNFLAGELSDLVLHREPISLKPSADDYLEAPKRPQKGIMDNLSRAMTLGKPVAIEYISPITQAVRYKKMTISEMVETKNEGYIRGIDRTTGASRVISITTIKSISHLE